MIPREAVEVRGGFRMVLDNSPIGAALRAGDSWEEEVEEAIFRWGDPSGLFLELGAQIGCFTLPAAKRFKYVLAVEPHPGSFNLLAKNIVLNNLNNVRLIRAAVGDIDGSVYLHIVEGFRLTLGNTGACHTIPGPQGPYITVPMLRPQTILCGQKPQFVKMDIEGDEYKVLMACPELLEAEVLIVEFSPYQIKRQGGPPADVFLDLLRDAGFTFPAPRNAHYQNIVARRK